MTFFVRGFWSPFFVFCIFRASESLFGEIYLLEVVRCFDKDHFLLYDFIGRGFWCPFLHFSGLKGPLRQTYLLEVVITFNKDHFSFYDFFLLRPFFVFCVFRASGHLRQNLFTRGGNDFPTRIIFHFMTFFFKGPFSFLAFFGPQKPFFEEIYLLEMVTNVDKDHFSF